MGNCLVTNLKEIVNNDNLSYLGKIKFEVLGASTNDNYLNVAGITEFNVIGEESKLSQTSKTQYLFPSVSSSIVYFADGEYTFTAKSKYNVAGNLQAGSQNQNEDCLLKFNIEEFNMANLTSIVLIKCPHVYGDITKIDTSAVTYIDIMNSKISGDVKNLNINSAETVILRGTKIVGDVAKLTLSSSLTMLDIANTDIEGNLKSMAEKLWNNGTGKVSGYIMLTNVVSGESDRKRMWGTQTCYEVCGSYNPYIVFSQEGVSLSATKPE